MNSLIIAVIGIAVAQALTILLTIGREGEIKKLRELVYRQQLLVSEITGWLEREGFERTKPRMPNPVKELSPKLTVRPCITADQIRQANEAISKMNKARVRIETEGDGWVMIPEAPAISEPIADEIKAPDVKEPKIRVPEPAITKVTKPAKTLKDLLATVEPHATEDETKRLTEATNWLKEDVGKARKIG
ncbi:MAG: hypothetical protein ACXWKP_20805 [Bradyrhizobium sp.]